jgi:2-dehydro-3-deoxyphosphooctonate aldolase (KDO 8-P synthase)
MELYNKITSSPTIICGPCVIENNDIMDQIAETIIPLSLKYNFNFIFKASFDKANRTSIDSFRGNGIEAGLEKLQRIKNKYNLFITTDIHESYQADMVKNIVDIIQIPAFLCRQTDLLLSAANTGKIVNIKKAQFLNSSKMIEPVKKILSTGNEKIMLTERGSMFGYQNIVVDYAGLIELKKINLPIVFDATHSSQIPGDKGSTTGGNRLLAPYLANAAAAIGIRNFFFEVHPEPENALSDGPNSIRLSDFENVLKNLTNILNLNIK